jgi:enoyl-CoA hydratase/carnithine racemase
VPGWGGCYLLPNLIGPAEGAQGHHREPAQHEPDAQGPEAFELGIADAMFEPADFLEESIAGPPRS